MHTPTPWALDKNSAHGDYDICMPSYEGGKPVGWFFYIGHGLKHGQDDQRLFDEGEANAEFIVHAVNCHDELVEALEDAIEELNEYSYGELGESYNNPKFNDLLARAGKP